MAADADQSIMKACDAVLAPLPGHANRVACVIAPDGRIVYSCTNLNPDQHVENTRSAREQWRSQQKS